MKIPARTAYRYSEVAEMLGVHQDTVRRWARNGEVSVAKIGRTVLIPATELDRLMNDQKAS